MPSTISPISSPPTKSNSTDDNITNPPSNLTIEQKSKIELNKSIAKAKFNLKICTNKLSKAKEEGMEFVKLEELLVEETWLEALPNELQKPYAKNLCTFVEREMRGSVLIYPLPHLIFNALNTTPFGRVKAFIIGQDPYHGPGQAMGLSFSVHGGIKIPSSLGNMFKELKQDLGCSIPTHGNLEGWALQTKRTKKAGIVGKYGTRYGASLRKQINRWKLVSTQSTFVNFVER